MSKIVCINPDCGWIGDTTDKVVKAIVESKIVCPKCRIVTTTVKNGCEADECSSEARIWSIKRNAWFCHKHFTQPVHE